MSAFTRLQTTKFPLCCLVMELAEQMRARQARLEVKWAPREVNEEADALTNEDFGGFATEHRVRVDLGNMGWKVLPDMLEAGKFYYQDLREVREAVARTPGGKRGRRRTTAESLRVRDPW